MLDLLRATTIHPALTHLPLGAAPLTAIAYAIAAWRRSERWSFVADVAAAFTAVTAVITAAFGLVSWALLEWPGGVEPWPTIHLVMGGLSAALALSLAGARGWLRLRRDQRRTGAGWAAGAGGLLLMFFFTGWVGGEVLVYHSGMAVKAAAEGSLAPPLTRPSSPPEDLEEAMRRLRPAWASATATLARSLVEEPTAGRFAAIEADAQQIEELARWVAAEATPPEERCTGVTPDHDAAGRSARLRGLARELLGEARALRSAARREDLPATARALGAATAICAECHLRFRWQADAGARDAALCDPAAALGVTW